MAIADPPTASPLAEFLKAVTGWRRDRCELIAAYNHAVGVVRTPGSVSDVQDAAGLGRRPGALHNLTGKALVDEDLLERGLAERVAGARAPVAALVLGRRQSVLSTVDHDFLSLHAFADRRTVALGWRCHKTRPAGEEEQLEKRDFELAADLVANVRRALRASVPGGSDRGPRPPLVSRDTLSGGLAPLRDWLRLHGVEYALDVGDAYNDHGLPESRPEEPVGVPKPIGFHFVERGFANDLPVTDDLPVIRVGDEFAVRVIVDGAPAFLLTNPRVTSSRPAALLYRRRCERARELARVWADAAPLELSSDRPFTSFAVASETVGRRHALFATVHEAFEHGLRNPESGSVEQPTPHGPR